MKRLHFILIAGVAVGFLTAAASGRAAFVEDKPFSLFDRMTPDQRDELMRSLAPTPPPLPGVTAQTGEDLRGRAGAQVLISPVETGLAPRQREIFQLVAHPDGGFISQELHREFWAPIIQQHGSVSEKDVADIRAMIDVAVGVGIAFQRETWSSAILSARTGKVTYTPGYLSAQLRVRNLTALSVQRGLLDQAAANGDRLLEAAAARQPAQVKDKSIYITEDLASRIVAGLDGSRARLARLVNPVWSERSRVLETRYDDIGLAILTDEPFTRADQIVGIAGQTDTRLTTLSRTVSAGTALTVSVFKPPVATSNVDALLSNVASSGFSEIGAKMTTTGMYQDFRGNRSIIATGKASTGGRTYFISQRVTFRVNRRTLTTVLAIAGDLMASQLARESLELNLMLIGQD